MKLVAHGISGHGSMPREDNAIVHVCDRGREDRCMASRLWS